MLFSSDEERRPLRYTLRRALRRRGAGPFTSVAGVLVLALSLAPAPRVKGDAEKLSAAHEFVRSFGSANSFEDALLHHGASAEDASALVEALRGKVDFRRAKRDDQLIFWRDGSASLLAFEYRSADQGVFRVQRAAGKLQATRVEQHVQLRRIARGTYIRSSLGQSLRAIGLGALTLPIERALASKIALSRDARPRDRIKVIVDAQYAAGSLVKLGTIHAIEYVSGRVGRLQAFWFESSPGKGEFFDPRGRALRGSWLRTPVRYDRISSGYNLKRRHPILKRIVPHYGVDYSACRGTPVWAAADGQVTFAGRRGPNGNLVSLRHDSGYESHYAHLSKIGPNIRPGRRLKQRQVLGFVGSTGRSTGPHLHFALKRDGHFVDPTSQLDGPGAPLPRALMPRFQPTVRKLRAELAEISVSRAAQVAHRSTAP